MAKDSVLFQRRGAVAAATILAQSLPALSIRLTNRSGEVIRVYEIPDPRAGICQSFNELGGPYVATPVVSG